MPLDQNLEEADYSWIQHMEEMRQRIFRCLLAVTVLSFITFACADSILDFLAGPIRKWQASLYFTSPYEALITRLNLSVVAAMIISSPYLLHQLWLFVAPGLYEKEKKSVLFMSLPTAGFFLSGVAFAFFAALPFMLGFFLGFQTDTLKPLITLQQYVGFVMKLLLLFGFTFTFPVIVIFLTQLGVLSAAVLTKQRKILIVGIFIAAAILTPPDVVSQIFLALPLMLLLEIAIFGAKWVEKRRA